MAARRRKPAGGDCIKHTKAILLIKAPCVESVGIFSSDSPSLMRKRWTCSNGKGARVREVGRARVRLAGRARDTGRRRRLRTSPVLLPAATRCASWEMATHHVFTARRGNSDQRVGWRVQCAPWRRSAGRLVRSIAALSPAPPKPHPPSPRTCSGVNLLHQLALLQVPDLDLAVHRAGDGARPARVNVDRKHAQLVPLEAVLALEHLRLRVPARVERRKSGVEAGRVMGKRAGMGLGGPAMQQPSAGRRTSTTCGPCRPPRPSRGSRCARSWPRPQPTRRHRGLGRWMKRAREEGRAEA